MNYNKDIIKIYWRPVTAEEIKEKSGYTGNDKLLRKFINGFFSCHEPKWGRHTKGEQKERGRPKKQYIIDFQKIAILKEIIIGIEVRRKQIEKLCTHWSSIEVDRFLKMTSSEDYIKSLPDGESYFKSKAEVEEWCKTSELTTKDLERILQIYYRLVSEIYTKDNKWNDEGLYKFIRPKRKNFRKELVFSL